MGSWPGSPFSLEDKAPPEPPGHLIVEDLQTLHITTNKKNRGLDTIQASSFFPWWLLLFFQGEIFFLNPEILKNPEKSQACSINF